MHENLIKYRYSYFCCLYEPNEKHQPQTSVLPNLASSFLALSSSFSLWNFYFISILSIWSVNFLSNYLKWCYQYRSVQIMKKSHIFKNIMKSKVSYFDPRRSSALFTAWNTLIWVILYAQSIDSSPSVAFAVWQSSFGVLTFSFFNSNFSINCAHLWLSW